MGYLDELHSITKAVRAGQDAASSLQHKSIARGAMDGTLQFPNLVSDAIPIDMASTVTRTLERVYASFVQTYLSLNNTIDISVDRNPTQYLKRFHHNIKVESTDLDLYKEHCIDPDDEEYKAMMERVYDGTTKAYVNRAGNKMIVFNFSEKFTHEMFEAHQEALEESLKDIDFYPFPNIGNNPFYEAPGDVEIPDLPVAQGDKDSHDLYMKRIENELRGQVDTRKEGYKLQHGDRLRVPVMTDNDVKKANDLQPYLMQVRLMAVNDQNEFVQFMDFIVGVKVVMHNIKSDEMILNIQSALQNNNKIFNFIRWTTGEKTLFKDLLLHLNDVRLDVANRSKGASPWWITLKRLKNTSQAQAAFFSRTQIVPNSTITVSSYDVDAIQRSNGFDLRNPKYALQLMKTLFLMNFVIVDEGTRTVEVLYDGSSNYQTYALETFEREVSMNSNKIGKELTRMISR